MSTDVSTISEEKRAEIAVRLATFACQQAEVTKSMEPLCAALAPLIDQEAAIDDEREAFLESEGVEVAGTCDTCGRLLFAGERGSQPWEDESLITYCAEHAMTYGDLKRHWSVENPPRDDEDPDDAEHRETVLKWVADHVAGGGSLDDKVTTVLEARL